MTTMLSVRLLVTLVLFALPLAAQAPQRRASVETPYTVRITNDQLTSVRIYVRFATVRIPLGSLFGGESKCIALPAAATNHDVAFEATNVYGTRVSDVVFVSSHRPSWEWRVSDAQSWSFLSVQPTAFSCMR